MNKTAEELTKFVLVAIAVSLLLLALPVIYLLRVLASTRSSTLLASLLATAFVLVLAGISRAGWLLVLGSLLFAVSLIVAKQQQAVIRTNTGTRHEPGLPWEGYRW